MTTTTMSCYGWDGITPITTGSAWVEYSMTVPTGHGSSCKGVAALVDVTPTGDAYDYIAGYVDVYHNGSHTYGEQFFTHSGTDSLFECKLVGTSGYFSAQDGDVIVVTYSIYKDSSNFSPVITTPTIGD